MFLSGMHVHCLQGPSCNHGEDQHDADNEVLHELAQVCLDKTHAVNKTFQNTRGLLGLTVLYNYLEIASGSRKLDSKHAKA